MDQDDNGGGEDGDAKMDSPCQRLQGQAQRPAGMTEWGGIPTDVPGCFLREREHFLIRTHVQRNLENNSWWRRRALKQGAGQKLRGFSLRVHVNVLSIDLIMGSDIEQHNLFSGYYVTSE